MNTWKFGVDYAIAKSNLSFILGRTISAPKPYIQIRLETTDITLSRNNKRPS